MSRVAISVEIEYLSGSGLERMGRPRLMARREPFPLLDRRACLLLSFRGGWLLLGLCRGWLLLRLHGGWLLLRLHGGWLLRLPRRGWLRRSLPRRAWLRRSLRGAWLRLAVVQRHPVNPVERLQQRPGDGGRARPGRRRAAAVPAPAPDCEAGEPEDGEEQQQDEGRRRGDREADVLAQAGVHGCQAPGDERQRRPHRGERGAADDEDHPADDAAQRYLAPLA